MRLMASHNTTQKYLAGNSKVRLFVILHSHGRRTCTSQMTRGRIINFRLLNLELHLARKFVPRTNFVIYTTITIIADYVKPFYEVQMIAKSNMLIKTRCSAIFQRCFQLLKTSQNWNMHISQNLTASLKISSK